MDVRDQLATVYELQQADSALRRIEKALAALDNGAAANAAAAAAQAESDRAAKVVRELDKELLDTELQIKSNEAKRKDYEKRMYSGTVRNPKELADMQEEVASLAANVSRLEDKALDLMERLEPARAEAKATAAAAAAAAQEAARIVANFAQESARLKGEQAAQQAARQALAAKVEPGLLRRYDGLRQRHAGLGMAKLAEGMCSGCRTSLSRDVVQRAQAAEDVVLCDSCGRMLFPGE